MFIIKFYRSKNEEQGKFFLCEYKFFLLVIFGNIDNNFIVDNITYKINPAYSCIFDCKCIKLQILVSLPTFHAYLALS